MVQTFIGQCLIFCQSKVQCEQYALAFVRHIEAHPEDTLVPDPLKVHDCLQKQMVYI